MGFFDSLLGMFGVGQAKLDLPASTAQAGPGQVIDATLTLTGGSRPLPLNALSISVKRTRMVKKADGKSINIHVI